MDIGQIVKQIEWVDEERRRDKTLLLSLQDRLSNHIEHLEGLQLHYKELEEEVKRLSVQLGRISQFDGALVQQRVELRRIMDESEKKAAKAREESERLLRNEIKNIDDKTVQLNNKLEQITELRKDLQLESSERQKLQRSLDEALLRVDEMARTIEDFGRTIKLIDEVRRQDQKQIDGLHGEIIALRKRIDERRSELEALSVTLSRLEMRVNDLHSLEASRQAEQKTFIEQQALLNVERERVMKEWIKKLEGIEKQSQEIELQLHSLDETHRSVKRTQDEVTIVSNKLERRINEITELQRLTEERFRQEWITFKGDDQKRWADFSLTIDERYNELNRLLDKLLSRVTQLEDQFILNRELLAQLNAQTEKGLQSLFAAANEWIEIYQKVKNSQK